MLERSKGCLTVRMEIPRGCFMVKREGRRISMLRSCGRVFSKGKTFLIVRAGCSRENVG